MPLPEKRKQPAGRLDVIVVLMIAACLFLPVMPGTLWLKPPLVEYRPLLDFGLLLICAILSIRFIYHRRMLTPGTTAAGFMLVLSCLGIFLLFAMWTGTDTLHLDSRDCETRNNGTEIVCVETYMAGSSFVYIFASHDYLPLIMVEKWVMFMPSPG